MSIQSNFIPSLAVTKKKILIAVPCKDMMYSHFAYCLQELVEYHTRRGIETQVEFNMGTLIGSQREKLADKALEVEATHILWLDSDMMFPKTICEKLLSHDLDFVACNYSTRALPTRSVAFAEIGEWDSFIGKDETGLISIAGVGLGCALIKTAMLDDIPKPWFPITYNVDANDYLGEDMNFCQKIIESGYVVAIDCDASREVYHIGSIAFGWKQVDKA
jgi:hypothetical protein